MVEEDQHWLKGTLSRLDAVKKQTIEEAYKHINKDFGSIFGTLLPGTNAKLQPVEGKPLSEGLEVMFHKIKYLVIVFHFLLLQFFYAHLINFCFLYNSFNILTTYSNCTIFCCEP